MRLIVICLLLMFFAGVVLAQLPLEVNGSVGLGFQSNTTKPLGKLEVGQFWTRYDELTASYAYTNNAFGQGAHTTLVGYKRNDLVVLCTGSLCSGLYLTTAFGNTHLTAQKRNIYGNDASWLRLPASNHVTGQVGFGLAISNSPKYAVTVGYGWTKAARIPMASALTLGYSCYF